MLSPGIDRAYAVPREGRPMARLRRTAFAGPRQNKRFAAMPVLGYGAMTARLKAGNGEL